VAKFIGAGDKPSARLIDQICREEIAHVEKGMKWWKWLCERDGSNPVSCFHLAVKTYMDTKLPPPFNTEARTRAGMPPEYYLPLALTRGEPRHRPKDDEVE
jgi:uncharacterized ferritin-like protein (DUF455 family)